MPQYDINSGITNTISNTTTSFSIGEVWTIISILLAIIGGFFLFTTYFNKEKENTYTGFKKTLYDFLNFKITIIEPIFRVAYLITAIAITLCSFSYLTTNFFAFLAILVFGNIIARLSFEFFLLILKLFKDVAEINSKLSKKDNKPKIEFVKKTKKSKKENTELKENDELTEI